MVPFENASPENAQNENNFPETIISCIDRVKGKYDNLLPELEELARDFARPHDLEKTIREERIYKDMLIRNIEKIIEDMISMKKCLDDLGKEIHEAGDPVAHSKSENMEEQIEQNNSAKSGSFSGNINNVLSKYGRLLPDLEELENDLRTPHNIKETIKNEGSYKGMLARKIRDIKKDMVSMQECLEPLKIKLKDIK